MNRIFKATRYEEEIRDDIEIKNFVVGEWHGRPQVSSWMWNKRTRWLTPGQWAQMSTNQWVELAEWVVKMNNKQ